MLSEQSELMLELLPPKPSDGGSGAADTLEASTPAHDQPALAKAAADAEPAASPASVSQEIWERKGWNSMDGGGWNPWRRE